jgi:hypothetical protein
MVVVHNEEGGVDTTIPNPNDYTQFSVSTHDVGESENGMFWIYH